MTSPLTALRLGLVAVAAAAVTTTGSAVDSGRTAAAAWIAEPEGPIALMATQAEPAIMRSRYVTVATDALPDPRGGVSPVREPAVLLDLFPDAFVDAVFERYDPNPAGVTWVGRVAGVSLSSVTLVYSDGLLAASIVMPGGVYQIRPAPVDVRAANPQARGELHIVSQVNQAAFPREAEPVEVTLPQADGRLAALPVDTADVIDLMVLYTPAAVTRAGGVTAIGTLINLGVSETNTSYANSGVRQRLRLVHSAQVAYTETNDFSTNLVSLRTGTGALNGVAALRDTHRADLVMLLVRPAVPDACGIAYIMSSVNSSFAPFGFSVSDVTCVSPNYTFAHELGHNMGARHDWYVDGGTTPYPYAHGYVNPAVGQRWRTVMSYNDLCSAQGFNCTRLLHWANPDHRFNPLCTGRGFTCSPGWYVPGTAMGVPAGTRTSCQSGNVANQGCDADDRAALNNTALTVANFRAAVSATARR